MVKYVQDLQNNGTNYHVGPTFQLRLSNYLNIRGAFGYQGGTYDSNGVTGDTSDLGSYFANVDLQNNLNLYFVHSLAFGHQAELGVVSNFTETNYVHYQASWDVIRKVNLGFFALYEDAKESGGLFAEHFRYYAVGLNAGLQVTPKIAVSLGYQFSKRETTDDGQTNSSANIGLAFTENRITLHVNYGF
jgi:hypothetical protein